MKKLLFVLAVFCYTATFVSAQVETMEKVVNAVDELSPAAKAAAADAGITSKVCTDGKVCYMRKGEGATSNVVNWDVEKGAFVNVLDKDGKVVTCDTNAKSCAKGAKKGCCSKGAKKSCSKGAKKSCSKTAKKSCSKTAAKTCSHGKKAAATACAPGCTKACCSSDAKVKGAHKCEPGCTKACCAKS